MAQIKKPKTLEQKRQLLSEKLDNKQISKKDFELWEKVYREQHRDHYPFGVPDEKMSDTEIRHFNAE